MELLGESLKVHILQKFFHSLCAHACLEVVLVFLPVVPVLLLRKNLISAQRRLAGVRDDIVGEIQHLLQDARANVQQQPHPGGNALEVPDMADGSCQLDVAHPLPADLGTSDLHAAAVADFSLVADLLILAAVALPVLGGAKNPLTKEAIPLGLEGPVVDSFRLLHLAVGPGHDLLRGCHADFDGVKRDVVAGIVIDHVSISSFNDPEC